MFTMKNGVKIYEKIKKEPSKVSKKTIHQIIK